MAVNFMASTSVNLSGSNLHSAVREGFCSYNGFMTQVFVVQSMYLIGAKFGFASDISVADYWVFIIATYTFLVLADYKHNSSRIEEHRIVLWILPWFFSILWASIGLGVVGYGDIGACKSYPSLSVVLDEQLSSKQLICAGCWFTSDKVRLLVNFVPRWLIIITILGLYLRLYFLLRKAHARFMSFGDETSRGVELSTSRSDNTIAQDSSFYISSSANDSCEQGGRPTHIRIGDQLPVLKKVRNT
jgi:hypothetical protein